MVAGDERNYPRLNYSIFTCWFRFFSNANGSSGAGKMITSYITQSQLTTLLVQRNWMYRDARNVLQGYATRIEQGYIEHVMSAPVQDKIGVDHVYSSAKITAKGMARLAQILAKEQAA